MGGKLIKNPLQLIVFLSFIFLVVTPVAYTVISGILLEDSAIDNFMLLNEKSFLLLFKSILIAFLIALLSTLFGTILGFILYKTNVKFRSFFKIALLIPLFISPYIIAVAWKDFLFLLFDNANLISSYIGVVLVLTTVYTPLAMLITGSAFSNINIQLEESGLMITDLKTVILKIIIPIIKPALMSSFVLIFIFSISEFSVPSYFGVPVFTTEIFTQFSAFYNHSFAIIQSSFLILICISLLYSERKYIADAPFLSIGTKGSNSKVYYLSTNTNFTNLTILVISFIISVISPFAILIIQSFKGGVGHFRHALELLAPTFINSIFLALVGAILVVLVGFSAAYYSNDQPKIKATFNWLLLFIFAIPSIIYGISLIKFYNQPSLNYIYSSSSIILIAYVGKFSFISSKLIANAISQIPYSLSEAAKVQGTSTIAYLLKILIPLILPTLFVTFIISFILCIGELGTSIMLYPPGTEIMPIKVFTIMANAPQALTSSMVLIVLIITSLLITSFYFMAKPFFKKYIYIND